MATAAPGMSTRIRTVTPRLVERAVGGKVWNPRTRFDQKRTLLVFVEDEAGRRGVGERWLHGTTPDKR
jgi:hypothetical protein